MSTGLRERKKLECRREIVAAARDLVAAHGLAAVTVNQIAEAAGVSPRTFFNYFSCKEDALVGVDPAVIAEKADELRARPAEEAPLDALRAVLTGWLDPEVTLPYRELRNELVSRYPELTPRYLAVMTDIEAAFTVAVAERMGVDPALDPLPELLVAATLAATRAAIRWWERSDRSRSLAEVYAESFAVVAPIGSEGPR